MNRRDFIATGTTLAIGSTIPTSFLAEEKYVHPDLGKIKSIKIDRDEDYYDHFLEIKELNKSKYHRYILFPQECNIEVKFNKYPNAIYSFSISNAFTEEQALKIRKAGYKNALIISDEKIKELVCSNWNFGPYPLIFKVNNIEVDFYLKSIEHY